MSLIIVPDPNFKLVKERMSDGTLKFSRVAVGSPDPAVAAVPDAALSLPITPQQAVSLNSRTNSELMELANSHSNCRSWLEALSQTLAPRTSYTAVQPRKYVAERLAALQTDPTPMPESEQANGPPWRLLGLLVTVVGALAAGIAHGAGGEIWKVVWPRIRELAGM
jgi:hypothetical protein